MAEKDTEMKLDRIQKLLQQCDDLGAMVSPWERGFLESVLQQIEEGRTFSTKQVTVVHRVEAKVKKAIKGDPEWEASWDAQKAWNFKTAVTYYKNAPEQYFSHILGWFDNNEGKIPPRNYYKKIVENKYAQRVITSLSSEPKYPAGSTVMLRATARSGLSYYVFQDHRNIPLFVIEPTDKAVSAAAGCRIYTVLSSISSKLFEVEERWIKKYREPKNKVKTHTWENVPF